MSPKTQSAQRQLLNARRLVPVNTTWRHYKGGLYAVCGHCINTTTGEASVLYYRIDGPEYNNLAEVGLTFCRPLAEWVPEKFNPVLPLDKLIN